MAGRIVRGGEALTLQGTPLSKRERKKLRRALKRWADWVPERSVADDTRGGRLVSRRGERQPRLPLGPHAEGPLQVGDRVQLIEAGDSAMATGTILLIHPDAHGVWDEVMLSIVMDDDSEIEALPGEVRLIARGGRRETYE